MLRGKSERVKRETGQSRAKQQKFLVSSSPSIFFRPFSFRTFLFRSATKMLATGIRNDGEEKEEGEGEKEGKRNRRRGLG